MVEVPVPESWRSPLALLQEQIKGATVSTQELRQICEEHVTTLRVCKEKLHSGIREGKRINFFLCSKKLVEEMLAFMRDLVHDQQRGDPKETYETFLRHANGIFRHLEIEPPPVFAPVTPVLDFDDPIQKENEAEIEPAEVEPVACSVAVTPDPHPHDLLQVPQFPQVVEATPEPSPEEPTSPPPKKKRKRKRRRKCSMDSTGSKRQRSAPKNPIVKRLENIMGKVLANRVDHIRWDLWVKFLLFYWKEQDETETGEFQGISQTYLRSVPVFSQIAATAQSLKEQRWGGTKQIILGNFTHHSSGIFFLRLLPEVEKLVKPFKMFAETHQLATRFDFEPKH